MPSHDDFQALVNRVHHAATERLATMALYRAVDAWCALKQRSPVQLLSLHVSNTSSPWLKRRTYTVQTSSPSTVHAALCAILPECFECIPAAHRMEGSHSPASPSSDDDWAWNHPLLLKLATLAAALRAAPTMEMWWTTLMNGIPMHYVAHTGRTTWNPAIQKEWEKLRIQSNIYTAHTAAGITHFNGRPSIELYFNMMPTDAPPLSQAQAMLLTACPLLMVHDTQIMNVAFKAHTTEICRYGTELAETYNALHHKPMPANELSNMLRYGLSSPTPVQLPNDFSVNP